MRLAHTIQLGVCDDPACQCVHLILADEAGDFATAVIPVRYAPGFIKDFQDAAYAVVVGKTEGDNSDGPRQK